MRRSYKIKGEADLKDLAPKLADQPIAKQIKIIKEQLKESRDYLELLDRRKRTVKFAMRRIRIKLIELRYAQEEK